jgi:hypothetical protein
MPAPRLQPPLSKDEALAWLREQAAAAWGKARLEALENGLRLNAEAMAAVSAAELPDELEPLFP